MTTPRLFSFSGTAAKINYLKFWKCLKQNNYQNHSSNHNNFIKYSQLRRGKHWTSFLRVKPIQLFWLYIHHIMDKIKDFILTKLMKIIFLFAVLIVTKYWMLKETRINSVLDCCNGQNTEERTNNLNFINNRTDHLEFKLKIVVFI